MQLISPKFSELVESLLNVLKLENCVEAKEFRLAKKLNALPLGYDLLAFVFLRCDGEVVWFDFLDKEIRSLNDSQGLIRAIVRAAKRYPQFVDFIPEQPENSETCLVCNGTKFCGEDVSTNQPAKCVICAGLGWTIEERKKQKNIFDID